MVKFTNIDETVTVLMGFRALGVGSLFTGIKWGSVGFIEENCLEIDYCLTDWYCIGVWRYSYWKDLLRMDYFSFITPNFRSWLLISAIFSLPTASYSVQSVISKVIWGINSIDKLWALGRILLTLKFCLSIISWSVWIGDRFLPRGCSCMWLIYGYLS